MEVVVAVVVELLTVALQEEVFGYIDDVFVVIVVDVVAVVVFAIVVDVVAFVPAEFEAALVAVERFVVDLSQ